MTVSLSEKEAKDFLAKEPKAFEEIWQNKQKFMGLRVDLSAISVDRVRELIETSWQHTASRRGK